MVRRVLTAVAADPLLRVHQVPVLSGAERDQILTGWNDTAAPVPAATVPELFAAQAAAQPDAVAVVSGDEVLSYRGLDAAANRLARLLGRGRRARVGRGRALDRSEDLLIALLAVLQGGGGVPAGRPGLSRGADRVHAGRRAPGGDHDHGRNRADLPVLAGVPVIAVDVPVAPRCWPACRAPG